MNPLTNTRNITKLNERELALGISERASWHNEYKDSAWIFVGGLSYELTEGDLLCVFSQYGEIVNINLVRDKKTGKTMGYGFVCYEDQRSTILAVDNFNGIKLCGRTIRVDHVNNYRMPKEDGEADVISQALREKGCAPSAMAALTEISKGVTDMETNELLIKQEDDVIILTDNLAVIKREKNSDCAISTKSRRPNEHSLTNEISDKKHKKSKHASDNNSKDSRNQSLDSGTLHRDLKNKCERNSIKDQVGKSTDQGVGQSRKIRKKHKRHKPSPDSDSSAISIGHHQTMELDHIGKKHKRHKRSTDSDSSAISPAHHQTMKLDYKCASVGRGLINKQGKGEKDHRSGNRKDDSGQSKGEKKHKREKHSSGSVNGAKDPHNCRSYKSGTTDSELKNKHERRETEQRNEIGNEESNRRSDNGKEHRHNKHSADSDGSVKSPDHHISRNLEYKGDDHVRDLKNKLRKGEKEQRHEKRKHEDKSRSGKKHSPDSGSSVSRSHSKHPKHK